MFPNFESVADRERKRMELLERAQRRVKQAGQKREMYANADWVSDQGTNSSKSTAKNSTQTETVTDSVQSVLNDLVDQVVS